MKFLNHAQETINPGVTEADVREMLIQHVLTEEIFAKVFDNPEFHRKNNVAPELYKLEEKLLPASEKHEAAGGAAALLCRHRKHRRADRKPFREAGLPQGPLREFLQGLQSARRRPARRRLHAGRDRPLHDRAADWLCHKHFGKGLTTATWKSSIRRPAPAPSSSSCSSISAAAARSSRYKYLEELHANEVAILPYYVANLNIEATYHAITGQYAEFPGLVFVDTLDNSTALGHHSGHQRRFVRRHERGKCRAHQAPEPTKISVIIGNPPYNANQLNENENNKNREYPRNRSAHQGHVHRGTRPRRKPNCTTCMRAFSAGRQTALMKMASSHSSQIEVYRKSHIRRFSQKLSRKSSTKSM